MVPQNLQKFKDFLLKSSFITEQDLQEMEKLISSGNKSLEEILVAKDFFTDEQLGQLIADFNKWKFVSLSSQGVDEMVLGLIPEIVAKKQKVIAFAKTSSGVKVAMNNPADTTLIHLLKKVSGKEIIPYFATLKDISEQFSLYRVDIKEEFNKIIGGQNKQIEGDAKDTSAIKIVDMLISRGYEKNASDIHIEPYVDRTLIRFRIDGVMHDIIEVPNSIHELIISRIKVMSHLRTDEHQVPQDGKLQYDFNKEKVDVRVSVVPTTKGENAVLRLLSESSKQFSLDQIGLCEKDFLKLQEAIKKPWGMILATGPTGSGKTTMLYAILKILNRKEVNIATIEDPVEYNIDGITQIQVHPKANLTFGSGLKSIVRQDPDIIMVGEIRDNETADIAVNSAMTGHLVLSTLHTNDASTTIPRILDMGIEPFLVASTINIAIGQRLVRKICPKCIQSYETDLQKLSQKIPISMLEKLARGKEKITLYRGLGCNLCNQTGYRGRTGVFEILEMNDDVRKLLMENADADKIKAKAIQNGMTTMFDDAKEKVLNGVTTIEEMLRVIKS